MKHDHSNINFPIVVVVCLNRTSNYLFKVNKITPETRKICSKLTTKTPERRQCYRSGVFIVNSEHISHLFLVFLLLTLNK